MAILRARGGRSLTTWPPIRTSPSLGASSPAMVRSRVVLPQPEGPRRTRYSPSSVARSTPSTAWTRPPSNCLTSPRTSTTTVTPGRRSRAADQAAGPPLLEDGLDLGLGPGHRLLGGDLAPGRRGEHVGDHEGPEHLADGGVGRPRVADVGAPLGGVLEEGQLVGRLGPERVAGQPAVELGHPLVEGREVVQLRGPGGRGEVLGVVEEELLGRVDAVGVLGDDPVVEHVLGGAGVGGAAQGGHEADIVGDVRVGPLGGAPGRDGVEDVGQLAGDQALVVGGGVPGEDLVGHGLLEQLGHELDGGHRLRGVDHHPLVLVLDRGPVGPHQGPAGHVGVDLLGHADAELGPLGLLDLGPALEQLVPGAGALGQAHGRPQRGPVVAGVGHPAGRVGVVDAGGRVEAGLLGQLQLLAPALGASSVTSLRLLTLGSNCDRGAMYWMRSWPWPAWISAAIRVGIWALSMWSTVTLTPTFLPQSLANGSNQASWLGTKWLQSRILRSPESLEAGSVKLVAGAWPVAC